MAIPAARPFRFMLRSARSNDSMGSRVAADEYRCGGDLFYRVESAGMEWVTLEQPPCGQGDSSRHPVSSDRLPCITGTGGLKPARRGEQWRDPSSIRRDQAEAELSHGPSESDLNNPSCRRAEIQTSRRTGCRAESASRLGNTKNSRPITSSRRICRANSLKIRFALFRRTAVPNRLLTTIPMPIRGDGETHETRLKSGV